MPSNAISRWSRPTPATALSTAFALYISYKVFRTLESKRLQNNIEPTPTSPSLVDNFQFVQVNGKQLRIVHIPHELGSKVPLLVFIHGVGGQSESLSTHILAIDMCGYGASDVPESYDHYTTESYAEDIFTLLQRYKSDETVLICHSYGCAVGTHLYSRLEESRDESLENSIKAVILIGPKAAMSRHEVESREKFKKTPDWAVNLARKVDRMGGTHSQSVNRLLHASAGEDLRRKQLRWNKASKTFVLRRLLSGVRLPTPDDYRRIRCPILLMAGEDDRVCPSVNVQQIFNWCRDVNHRVNSPYIIPKAGHMPMLEKWEIVTPIISSFLIKDCEMTTMDPSWQITRKSQKENKWSLKNTEKWMNTPIISSPIGKGPGKFRAMKVLRQTDPEHSPSAFLAKHPEVEEQGYSVAEALRHFEEARPPRGIRYFLIVDLTCTTKTLLLHTHTAMSYYYVLLRHDHFKGELYLRYEPPFQLSS
ncbi:hypothetical protein BGZ76_008588 [Entomortierella beljakovae]|nr:hypothetical protein BGZ76_008588 [Entomortierella beljakovae]